MRSIGCTETWATNYHSTLRNITEEGRILRLSFLLTPYDDDDDDDDVDDDRTTIGDDD
jgi:hypothetical protein